MLKIFYHSDCIYFGGSERVLFLLMNEVSSNPSINVTFSYKKSSEYEEAVCDRLSKRVNIVNIVEPYLQVNSKYRRRYSFNFLTWEKVIYRIGLLKEVYQFYKYFKKNLPDILHINNGGFPGARSARAAALAGRLARVKLIIMVVNNLTTPYNSFSRLIDIPIDFMVFRSVNHFITGSRYARQQLYKISFGRAKVISIPNCSTDQLFELEDLHKKTVKYEENIILLGVFGQLIERKGHNFLFEALYLLRTKNWHCLVVGSGKLKTELENRIEELNLLGKIGFIEDNSNYKAIMNLCDIIIQPSIDYEDFPLTVVEALSLAKPIIGSNVGGISEQLNYGRAGIIVDPGDIDSLALCLKNLIENADLRETLAQEASLHFMNNYTKEVALKKYLDTYGIQ